MEEWKEYKLGDVRSRLRSKWADDEDNYIDTPQTVRLYPAHEEERPDYLMAAEKEADYDTGKKRQ